MLARFARPLLVVSAGYLGACATHAQAPCPPPSAPSAEAPPMQSGSVAAPASPTPAGAATPATEPSTAAIEPARAPSPRDATAFNAWIDESEHSRDLPLLVAHAFATAEARTVTFAVSYASGESAVRATATVTLDGLLDDSVRGEEHVLTFVRDAVGAPWRLEQATSRVRCWQGRGHAELSTAPCS